MYPRNIGTPTVNYRLARHLNKVVISPYTLSFDLWNNSNKLGPEIPNPRLSRSLKAKNSRSV
jgi:hypothetical protein